MTGWVLVTGAARRIGRAIALDLAAQGWDIIVHYNKSADDAKTVADEVQKLGRAVCLAEIDLSDSHAVENLIPSLAEEIGMIDALVNNASVFEPDINDPDGTRHWAVNAEAPRLLSKAFRDHLPPQERGVIVNMLDATTSPATFLSYKKSKSFLAELTHNMAKSYRPQVRVNGVACGYVLPSARQKEEEFSRMTEGKIVTVEQVSHAVRRLIESPGTTGQIISIA